MRHFVALVEVRAGDEIQATVFDALYPPGLQWYWRADFVKEISDGAVALHVEHDSRIPTMFSTMHLNPSTGRPTAWERTRQHSVAGTPRLQK